MPILSSFSRGCSALVFISVVTACAGGEGSDDAPSISVTSKKGDGGESASGGAGGGASGGSKAGQTGGSGQGAHGGTDANPFPTGAAGKGGSPSAGAAGAQQGGQSQGTAGQSQGTAGQMQGTAGQSQGTAGQSQGTAGQSQGTAGQSQGTAGQSQGTAGQSQGTAGQSQGQAGSSNPPPTDHCASASSGNGMYCGGSLSQAADQSVLYHCVDGKTVGVTPCANGCHVAPPGEPDACEGATQADPCSTAGSGNGAYCGGSLSPPGDLSTLYNCQNGATASSEVCASGCHIAPPGVADYCESGGGADPCSGATLGNGLYCGSALPGGDGATLYNCQNGSTSSSQSCANGCHVAPPGQSDYCEASTGGNPGDGSGVVSCSAIQWWNRNITYGPYQDYNPGQGHDYWWDTDLHCAADTQIQLRHDSKLVAQGAYKWGWQPTFVDQATGEMFRFLHLRPQAAYTTEVGKVYPAGTIVGLSGGDTADTGYPTYSTAAHLCVQTVNDYFSVFPPGEDACQ